MGNSSASRKKAENDACINFTLLNPAEGAPIHEQK